MKKLMLFAIIGIFLIGIAFAYDTLTTASVTLSKDAKTRYEQKMAMDGKSGDNPLTYSETTCFSPNRCSVTVFNDGRTYFSVNFNKGKDTEETTANRDAEVQRVLEQIYSHDDGSKADGGIKGGEIIVK